MLKLLRGILLLVAMLAALPAFAPAFAQEARLHFSHPIVGEAMEIVVDRVPPGAAVAVNVDDQWLETRPADASGCARFEFLVPAEMAGQSLPVDATVIQGGEKTEAVQVRFQWPQILMTGSRGGTAFLFQVDVVQSPDGSESFRSVRAVPLGSGQPGGAVRDGRGSRTFVVSDADLGFLSIVSDAELGGIRTLRLAPYIRGITRTADGSRILVSSAGNGTDAMLTVLDARAAETTIVAEIPIGPLGAAGGKIAVSEDGLYAFVAVDGLWVSQVNLLRNQVGCPISVGGRGQDEIRDLRIVDGSLFVLTGARDRQNYLTGYEVGALCNWAVKGPLYDGSKIGVGASDGDPSVLLLDGEGGEITVIDARTLNLRGGPYPVPPGADALLLTPNPDRRSGHLLYDMPDDAELLPIEFDRFTVGEPFALGFAARELPVHGTSRQIDLLILRAPDGRFLAVSPDTGRSSELPLPATIENPAFSVL